MTTLDPVLGTDLGDRDVWARAITRSKRQQGKPTPAAVDLASVITKIAITDTMHGSSSITLDIYDDDCRLVDSGFFDANRDGTLDPIDVNYPDGSRFWWRLAQVRIDCDRGGADLTMTFLERAAMQLLEKRGPVKVRRSKKTRAEFIKQLADSVGGIEFHSKELHDKQPLAEVPKVERERARRDRKEPGINGDETLTIKGDDASPAQLRQVERALDGTADLNAPELALITMLCAGIGESGFMAHLVSSAGAKGVFQLMPFWWDQIDWRDTESQARRLMTEGYYGKGGILDMVKAGRRDIGQMVIDAEGSDASDPGFYDRYRDEAQALLEAYGGGGSRAGGRTHTKQYHFRVGGPGHPRETYWDAMTRLADEVGWALFLDGQHLYYDDEMTLIQQKPAAIVRRGGPAMLGVNFHWDERQIATECQLELICDPFEFRAGEVLKLEGFGPASTGSSAGLPGRWLIEEIQRDPFTFASTFKLKQPERPKDEPRPETGTRPGDAGSAGGATAMIAWAKQTLGTREGSSRHRMWARELGYGSHLPWCSIWIGFGLSRVADLELPAEPAYSGAWLIWSNGHKVSLDSIAPGDLVVFDWGDGGKTDHVALYVGGGEVIGGNQSNNVTRVPLKREAVVGVVRPAYG